MYGGPVGKSLTIYVRKGCDYDLPGSFELGDLHHGSKLYRDKARITVNPDKRRRNIGACRGHTPGVLWSVICNL